MAVDGSITIGAIFTTDKFDRQIAKFEKDMQDTEDKLELKLNAKIQAENELKKHKQDIFDLEQEYEKLVPKVERYNELMSQSKAGINLSLKDFQFISEIQNSNVLSQYDKMGSQLDRMYAKEERLNAKVQQKAYAYKQVADKVDEYKQKIENVKIQKQVADVEKLKSGFNSVGSSIQSAVRRAGRFVVAIFGIRSAYLALRRAASDLESYDTQFSANLQYIRFVLTQAIAPVLRYIVSLVATLLGYLNAILNGWFGINLFSKGSADNFKKMKASAGGVSKAVKEIKKQLAGFDEMNVLTDQTDTSGGSAGGVATPEFDLSKMQGETPEWLKWIVDHKAEVLGFLAGLVSFLILVKLGLDGIKALGIGLMIWGIVEAIISLKDYLNDPSWENFGKIIQGVGIAILGLGIIIESVPLIVAGAIVLIVGIIVKYWNKIKEFFQKGIDWLSDKSDWIHEHFGDVIGDIYDTFVDNAQMILDVFNGLFTAIKGIFDGIIRFIKGVFSGDWTEAWAGIYDIWNSFLQGVKDIAMAIFDFVRKVVIRIATSVGETISGAFKAVINGVLSAIERILNAPIRAVNGLISAINAIPGVNIPKLNTFNLPRLAVGGIVNMPNKGTLVGGAIAGESGREGVIPLTDQQAMAQLGREIGKNVLVNTTNIIEMNSRVIGRELKKSQNEQEFAYNM